MRADPNTIVTSQIINSNDTMSQSASPKTSFTWQYPIVPSLSHYTFPTNNIPLPWTSLPNVTTPPDPVRPWSEQIATCRLTNFTRSIEKAHVIPRMEETWFARNEMEKFGRPRNLSARDLLHNAANTIGLRSDIHTLWDNDQFLLVPKNFASGSDDRYVFVAHSIVEDTEVVRLYHDTEIQQLYHVPYQYLFARFARSILKRAQGFLYRGEARSLVILSAAGTPQTKQFSPTDLSNFMDDSSRRRSPTKSQSPRKRPVQDSDSNEACVDPTKIEDCFLRAGTDDSGFHDVMSDSRSTSDSQISGLLGTDDTAAPTIDGLMCSGRRDETSIRSPLTSPSEDFTVDGLQRTQQTVRGGMRKRRDSGELAESVTVDGLRRSLNHEYARGRKRRRLWS